MTVFINGFLCVNRKMITRRMVARRLEKGRVNEEIPPQVEEVQPVLQGDQGARGVQVPIGGQGNEVSVVPTEMTNGEIREAFLALARAMTCMLLRVLNLK